MCGIAGYFNLNIAAEERLPLLRHMCDLMEHRGPDEDGYYADDIAGLSMKRLSIIDVAGGHQPMTSQDGTKQIVFNGEIYNYQQLRPILEAHGHRFTTNCDTEVILRQYEQDGENALQYLNGMFAIAVWDTAARRLFLARDRMGVKPLYYYWDGHQLIFASEIKALFAVEGIEKSINPRAIWDYLTFRYVPQPDTIWNNIHKLPPGHTLTISCDQPTPVIRRYWDIPYSDEILIKSDAEYQQEFEQLFLDAVRLRLIADVPVGILLSGGLDSSAVAAAISEVHNARLSSFSVAFADSPGTNELRYARQVAAHVGTDHNEIVIDDRQFRDFLPRLTYFTDEPLADLASVPLYYVSSLARQKVKVVLSGEGSDEILAGYGFNRKFQTWKRMRQYQRLPIWLRQDAAEVVGALVGKRDVVQRANRPVDEVANMTDVFSAAHKQALWQQNLAAYSPSNDLIQADAARAKTRDLLHRTLYVYCQSWLVEDLLMKADKMTMANSIELRVPFLDYRMVEWAARVPTSVKIRRVNGHYESKSVLRRFAATRLPSEIIERPKLGFPVPAYDWLSDRLNGWVREVLPPKGALLYQWLKPEAVQEQVHLGTSGSLMDRHRLWNLLILELWLQTWEHP
jgi:asparagine synthase (glutamine-hydrolysing)